MRTLSDGDKSGRVYQHTEASGTVDFDMVWTANPEMDVVGDVIIASDKLLEIEEGKTINFSDNTHLTINGTLNAQGTASNPITFTRTGTSSDWDGIQFTSGNIDHAVIEYALNSDGIDINSASPTIKNTTIQNCLYGLNLNNCNSLIQYCIVQNNEEGIFDRYGAVQYLDNTIKDQTPGLGEAHGLFLDATDPVLFRNVIDNNETGVSGTNAVYAQFGGSGQTGNNVIRNNNWGLVSYGQGAWANTTPLATGAAITACTATMSGMLPPTRVVGL